MVADLIMSEYGWSRSEVWWTVPFVEVLAHFDAILQRKLAEGGGSKGDPPVTDGMVRLYEVIQAVRKEKRL